MFMIDLQILFDWFIVSIDLIVWAQIRFALANANTAIDQSSHAFHCVYFIILYESIVFTTELVAGLTTDYFLSNAWSHDWKIRANSFPLCRFLVVYFPLKYVISHRR